MHWNTASGLVIFIILLTIIHNLMVSYYRKKVEELRQSISLLDSVTALESWRLSQRSQPANWSITSGVCVLCTERLIVCLFASPAAKTSIQLPVSSSSRPVISSVVGDDNEPTEPHLLVAQAITRFQSHHEV